MITYKFTNTSVTDTNPCPQGFVPVSIKSNYSHGWAAFSYKSGVTDVYAKTACLLAGNSQSTDTKSISIVNSSTGVLVYCPDWVEVYLPISWRGMYAYSVTINLFDEDSGEYEETSVSEYMGCRYYTDLQMYNRIHWNIQGGTTEETRKGFVGSYNHGIRCRALASQLYNWKLTANTTVNLVRDCIWNCNPIIDCDGNRIGFNTQILAQDNDSRTNAQLIIKNGIVSTGVMNMYDGSFPFIRFMDCSVPDNATFGTSFCLRLVKGDTESYNFVRAYLDAAFAAEYATSKTVRMLLPNDLYEEYQEQIISASSGSERTREDSLYINYIE